MSRKIKRKGSSFPSRDLQLPMGGVGDGGDGGGPGGFLARGLAKSQDQRRIE